MIIRPESDSELLALVSSVLSDLMLSPDTRAALAALFCRRDIQNFPLVADIGPRLGMAIGAERGRRILNELRGAGYLRRVFWRVPYVRSVPAFTSVCGAPHSVAALLEEKLQSAGKQRSAVTARPKGPRG